MSRISKLLLILFLLLTPIFVSAYFPPDAITVISNIPASGGTTCPTLLAASPGPRTLLNAYISTDGANDATINIGSTTILQTLGNQVVRTDYSFQFTNQAVTCTRANNKPFQFIITYVNYNIEATPPVTDVFITGQPIDTTGSFTGTVTPDPNLYYAVVILLIIAALTLFDFLRRIFYRHRRADLWPRLTLF